MLFFPTVDEDVQYFRSQGYTGSINDMHFKAMGDLGYTGSLNDRIHAYLTFKYGSYYAAMRDLRNGTSVFSLISAYAVNGFDPALVFDFKGNYFRKSATASTFPASITHAASTNATMTDGYGPEVVTNGKFGTDTAGWASGASAATSAAVSGEMQVTNVSSNGRVVTAIPTVVGRRYEVSGVGRVISGTAGKAASLYLTNNFGTTIQSGTVNYTTTDAPLGLFFTATATTSYISAIVMGNGGNVSAFDNVSVKEINPLSVSIQMDGKMTYADNGQLYEVAHYFWNINSSNRIISALQTTGSFAGKPIFEQRANGVTNNVTGANAGYSPNINVPFNIASRHGSTFVNGSHEGTLLTANTTPTILPDLSATDLILGSILMGTIGKFRMWSDDLGDVGITEATLPSTEPSLSLTFDGSETSFTVLDWSE